MYRSLFETTDQLEGSIWPATTTTENIQMQYPGCSSNTFNTQPSLNRSYDQIACESRTEQEMQEIFSNQTEVDIYINNIVCSFNVGCRLNLRQIALNGYNVEHLRESGLLIMKLRKPYSTASIWSHGRVTCTGTTSEVQTKIAARRFAKCLRNMGFNVGFRKYRVVNVLGTCCMPWGVKICDFSEKYRKCASYEPEIYPGVVYKMKHPKAALKIFSTGSITIAADSIQLVQTAVEDIYFKLYEFRRQRTTQEIEIVSRKHTVSLSPEEEMLLLKGNKVILP